MRVKKVSDLSPTVLKQYANGQILFEAGNTLFIGEIQGSVTLSPDLLIEGGLAWIRRADEPPSVYKGVPPEELMRILATQIKWGAKTTAQDKFRLVFDEASTEISEINGCLIFIRRTHDMGVALLPPGHLSVPDL